ncbi:unnamed protein product [marine sediment metagenome]|uniref:Uncharacterized protein n=1 Tax=marine sediment metagenome TaxID=412755 RepID=X1PMY8_9ZZZZ
MGGIYPWACKETAGVGLFHLLVWLLIIYALCRKYKWKVLVPPLVLLLFILLIGYGVI